MPDASFPQGPIEVGHIPPDVADAAWQHAIQVSENDRQRGGVREGAGRKSTWQHGTADKQIKVPGALADRVMALARELDTQTESIDPPTAPAKTPRKRTRPQRIASITADLTTLMDEYTAWREGMPTNLQDGEQAQRLDETIDQLQSAIDALDAIEPPRIGK